MKKTNLFFYEGELRMPGAIWRGIWNIEGTEMSKVKYFWHKVCCKFGRHKYDEHEYSEDFPGYLSCRYCGKIY